MNQDKIVRELEKQVKDLRYVKNTYLNEVDRLRENNRMLRNQLFRSRESNQKYVKLVEGIKGIL